MPRAYLFSTLSGLCIALAFLQLQAPIAVLLGWLAAFNLILAMLSSNASYRVLYLSGLVALPIGFYWLPRTIAEFGGFPTVAALAIMALFVCGAATQFLLVALIYRHLPAGLDRAALRSAIAVTVSELVAIKIFPWSYAHTQLKLLPIIQIADLFGALSITFLLFWVVETFTRLTFLRQRGLALALAPLTCLLAAIYGSQRIAHFSQLSAPTQTVAVIQGNITVREKHDVKYFVRNVQRYVELSQSVPDPEALIIWPETVVTDWISTEVRNVSEEPHLPNLGRPTLLGALTYETQERTFNSALGIRADGSLTEPYHKLILMPYGEYVPFSKTFPWMLDLAHMPQEFTAGAEPKVLDLTPTLKAAPLICYEDVVPSLAREATLKGAQLLVNLTNDAWFGDTAAPYQHHALATLRAVENRRYLVRSTNTGLTAVVDPAGRTASQLPVYSEGTLLDQVNLISELSPYTKWFGDKLWWALAIICACQIVWRQLIKRGRS